MTAAERPAARSRAVVVALLTSLVGAGCGAAGAERPAGYDAVAEDPPVEDLAYAPDLVPFTIEDEGPRLLGLAFVAGGSGPHPTAVILHGFPGHETNHDLARAVQRAGWNAVVFRYRGAWGSEGSFSFAGAKADVHRALRYLRNPATAERLRADPGRIVLAGHSFGGFLALASATEDSGVLGAASIAGFDMGAHALAMAERERERIETVAAFADAIVPLRGTTAAGLVEEMLAHGPRWRLTSLAPRLADRPVLLVAGARDAVAPRAHHHHPLVLALRGADARLLTEITLDDDHDFSAVRVGLARVLVAWLGNVERLSREAGSSTSRQPRARAPRPGLDVPSIRP